jgi:hypothetical protein
MKGVAAVDVRNYAAYCRLRRGTQMAEPISIVVTSGSGRANSPEADRTFALSHPSTRLRNGSDTQSTGESLNDKGVEKWNSQLEMKVTPLSWY